MRFSRSAHKFELNEEQEVRRVQVRTLQAIAHKIELNEDKEARREQVGTLQPIVRKMELNGDMEGRRGQIVTLQAIAHKIELNEEAEVRWTGLHAPGGRELDRTDKKNKARRDRPAHAKHHEQTWRNP